MTFFDVSKRFEKAGMPRGKIKMDATGEDGRAIGPRVAAAREYWLLMMLFYNNFC